MIEEINPNYDDYLFVDFDERKATYYLLFAKRRDIYIDEKLIVEDDCLIAYSDKSKEELAAHRSKLITSGYYKPTDLYIRPIKNLQCKK